MFIISLEGKKNVKKLKYQEHAFNFIGTFNNKKLMIITETEGAQNFLKKFERKLKI